MAASLRASDTSVAPASRWRTDDTALRTRDTDAELRARVDERRIDTVVEHVDEKRGDFLLRVVRTQKKVERLRAGKGINLPDTQMTVPSVTDEDRRALAFVAKHADAVGLSFVRRSDDVRQLHEELDRIGRPGIGVVLKIVTRAGFENLRRLLLEGLHRPPLADGAFRKSRASS